MSHYALPELPPDWPLVVEQDGREVRITYPPRSWASFRTEWITSSIMLAAAVLCCPLGLLSAEMIGFLVYVPMFGLGGSALALLTANRARTITTITVNPDWLFIVTRNLLITRKWEWSRAEVQAIGTQRGLRITGGKTSTWFFADRYADEVAWLAEVLCLVLRLGTLPPEAHEIGVTFVRNGDPEPSAGYLGVTPGRLTLRRDFQPQPEYRFSHGGLLPDGIAISGENLQCRVEDDGLAYLKIDKPALKLDVLVWGEKDALHQALARFWGAADEIVP